MTAFRAWRRRRPFWGGLLLVLAALELLYTANMNLGRLEVHLGPQGFLSYLLPLLLLLCGVLCWVTPAQRMFYGIIGVLTALYTFVGLNLGGFFAGMLLGIVGGALVIAWGPPRAKPTAPTETEPSDEGPTHVPSPADAETAVVQDVHDTTIASPRDHIRRPMQDGDTAFLPGLNDPPPPSHRRGPRALGVILLLVAVTGGLLVAGRDLPASAADCPKGLPSRSSVTRSAPAPAGTPSSPDTPAGKERRPARKSSAPTPAPTPTASATPGKTGNPVLDGIGDFFDGIGNLLGIGGGSSPAPSTSPTSSLSPSPSASAPTVVPTPTRSATPSSPSFASTAPVPEVPCLGPRVLGLAANAIGVPRIAVKPGVMKVGSLTMYNSTYDGVVDMPTAKGTLPALKFSMDKAVNKPFTLTMDEPGRAETVIKSKELVTDGNVRFYTPNFKGKLFGVIPVTFTPEQPPPLTLPVLWFTDVTIQLAYVHCDTLTADPLDIRERVASAS
ncbi:DUF6114 domain-containing protein [Actinoplanes sp. Pm04-4]|uniref:DUF6114 domain-containing protein n=1 Tax=Paractinoplanes pyxinae TaxID=2997416 RepID=A0ABT4AWD8_9ACTN|nr:DUF6114 domain-containing protein [Actinoplanes pyxinae]MCY1138549.1 DUF6114 domain-containing protein [Actinoplanes pyxinae]